MTRMPLALASSITIGLAGCSYETAANEVVKDQEAVASKCSDVTAAGNNLGTWPSGNVYFDLDPNYPDPQQVLNAMHAWEDQSAHMVTFLRANGANPRVLITDCSGPGGESGGYNQCINGCTAALCPTTATARGNVEHELGHLLGLEHEQQRMDRDHYIRLNVCAADGSVTEPRFDVPTFGPYDYFSTMHYFPTHPDIVRWDGSTVCANVDGAGNCLDGAAGPQGDVKASDGAKIIELYGAKNGWSKFTRTLDTRDPSPYTTDLQPFFDNVSSDGTFMVIDGSPALETWGGESLGIYARGTDQQIYKKYFDTSLNQWSNWNQLSSPNGHADSDPAITSWSPGRSDIVVRSGNEVFITSTPIFGTWQSLGAPPGGAASAPAITSNNPDTLVVLVRSNDNHIYQKACLNQCNGNSGTWLDWSVIGTDTFRGKPAAVARGGTIEVVAHGFNDQIWLAEFTGLGWGGWRDMGAALVLKTDPSCEDCTSPAIGSHSIDTFDVYVRGNDDHAWVATASDGNFTSTTALGGVLSGSPSAVSTTVEGRADVVVAMPEAERLGQYLPTFWVKTKFF